ncbi:hypothetical protein J7I93_19945 [Bacillus sp. ISL-47]|uniref:hypothetical protein n=1 Tax=Bacillus sp. ISL-47 TaxID=2819130 RepID=UPI001BEB63D2|nr:hypothetical protein [Bacillus sp. ISL-47]MBT2690430.1 hypothetical protein [Bacillus sp. ISL-47]MBT2707514.1 hypothetical protein [Pseudomonas sp. ISL-84]
MEKKKLKNAKQSDSSNVEFGMEFGDINANKLYELPFMNREKNKKKNNDKC